MGRKSSAKDRAYITQSERKDGYGSVRANHSASASTSSAVARRAVLAALPFTHCRITCEPWLDPVCTPDGDVFDVTAAVPAVRASGGRNPLTGEPLALKDLIRLRFHRVDGGGGGGEGEGGGGGKGAFGCPVTGKTFTNSSHIVAVRPTGNVFSFEAVERLNLKPKNFRDLLDDTVFARSDVIHLQDPADVSGTAAAKAEKMARAAAASGGGGLAAAAAAAGGAAASSSAAATSDNGGLDRSALGKDAQRILARLSSSAAAGAATSTTGPGGPPAGGRGDRGASRVPGADPRLRAPERERVAAPAFKSGAATWDTSGDDSSQQQLSFQMRKDAERRRRREEAEEEARKVREANRKAARSGQGEKKAPAPYGERVFERLALAAKAAAAASARPVAFTSSVTPLNAPSVSSSDLPEPPKRFRKPKAEKGYCRLRTSLGDLNLELFAEAAPRAVENFVVLAKAGYYDGCVFHRSVRNFCAQSGVSWFFFFFFFFFFGRASGVSVHRWTTAKRREAHSFFLPFSLLQLKTQDPTGTGRGGESIYGGPFPFEGPGAKSFAVAGGGGGGGASGGGGNLGGANKAAPSSHHYSHDARGVLAMANSGDRDSNGSQFYLLYKSARHLDGKHTVFGRVAGGMATLDAIEKIPTDERDRPLSPVVIEGAEVFVDPFEGGEEDESEGEEEEEAEAGRAAAAAKRAAAEAEAEAEGRKRARWFSGPAPAAGAGGGAGGVGRYLGDAAPVPRQPQQQLQQARAAAAAPAPPANRRPFRDG